MVAQPPSQVEHHRQTGEVTGRVLDRTVGGVVVADVQLGQLDFRVHHQRVGHVPDEHQILYRVRYCAMSRGFGDWGEGLFRKRVLVHLR